MHNEKREIKKFFRIIVCLLPLLIIPSILSGMETNKKPEKNSESHGEYSLKVNGDYISLGAKDASLKQILEEIGRIMKIDVVANIPPEKKISIELEKMYLEDVLKRLKTDYAYIAKTKKEKGMIIKIVLVPKGGGEMLPNNLEYNPQPPIQTYEYNPQPPLEKSMTEPEQAEVKSESESQQPPSLNENSSQSPDFGSETYSRIPGVGSKNNSQNSDAVSGSNSQTPDVGSESNPQTPDAGSEYNPQPSVIEKQ